MRALVVHPGANFAVADVYNGWLRGLHECGVEVIPYNLDQRLAYHKHAIWRNDRGDIVKQMTPVEAAIAACEGIKARCWEFWPDVVIIVCADFVPPDLLDDIRAHGHRLVIIHTESPYEDAQRIALAPHADINLLNDWCTLDSWREANSNSHYVPHAYDPDLHHPGPSTRSADVCFVGTGWQNRIDFLEKVDWTGVDFQLAGKWDRLDNGRPLLREDSPLRSYLFDGPINNAVTADLYRGSKIGFSLYRGEATRPDLAEGWAIGPREVEMAACGLFFPRDPRPEADELFPFLPTFSTPAEFRDIVDWYLPRDALRHDLAMRARAAVEGRTFKAHAARLIGRLSELPSPA